jgi:hypothetical protein
MNCFLLQKSNIFKKQRQTISKMALNDIIWKAGENIPIVGGAMYMTYEISNKSINWYDWLISGGAVAAGIGIGYLNQRRKEEEMRNYKRPSEIVFGPLPEYKRKPSLKKRIEGYIEEHNPFSELIRNR